MAKKPTPKDGRSRLSGLYESAEEEMIEEGIIGNYSSEETLSDVDTKKILDLELALQQKSSENEKLEKKLNSINKKHEEMIAANELLQAKLDEMTIQLAELKEASLPKKKLQLPEFNERAFLRLIKAEKNRTNHKVSELAATSIEIMSNDLARMLNVRRFYDNSLWNFCAVITLALYMKAKSGISVFDSRISRYTDHDDALLELYKLLLAVSDTKPAFDLPDHKPDEDHSDEIEIS